jgi:hypothetical protein
MLWRFLKDWNNETKISRKNWKALMQGGMNIRIADMTKNDRE